MFKFIVPVSLLRLLSGLVNQIAQLFAEWIKGEVCSFKLVGVAQGT